MANIDKKRKDRVRNMILTFGGSYLKNDQIYFAQNPMAANTIAYDPESKRIYQISIKQSYAHGGIDVLAAIVAHEVANTKVRQKDPALSRLEVSCIVVCNRCIQFLHIPSLIASVLLSSIRTFFEGPLFGCRRILRQKILVDQMAMRLLYDAHYSAQAYITFLNRELRDRNNFWIPRRWWHRWIVKKRLEEAIRISNDMSRT